MKDLIKNCQHYSSHYTYLIRGGDGQIVSVEKKTFDRDEAINFSQEADGLRWYCRKIGQDPSEVIEKFVELPSYCNLVTKYYQGELITDPVNPDLVKDKIQMAVEYYLEIFGQDDFLFSHGDYFIGNIVYKDNKVRWVIDWEHFNDKLPAGYDAVNCLVEVFLSSYQENILYSKSSIELAKNLLIKISRELSLPEMALKSPATWCRDTALIHKNIWGLQYNKLPHIGCTYQKCLAIDRIIGLYADSFKKIC